MQMTECCPCNTITCRVCVCTLVRLSLSLSLDQWATRNSIVLLSLSLFGSGSETGSASLLIAACMQSLSLSLCASLFFLSSSLGRHHHPRPAPLLRNKQVLELCRSLRRGSVRAASQIGPPRSQTGSVCRFGTALPSSHNQSSSTSTINLDLRLEQSADTVVDLSSLPLNVTFLLPSCSYFRFDNTSFIPHLAFQPTTLPNTWTWLSTGAIRLQLVDPGIVNPEPNASLVLVLYTLNPASVASSCPECDADPAACDAALRATSVTIRLQNVLTPDPTPDANALVNASCLNASDSVTCPLCPPGRYTPDLQTCIAGSPCPAGTEPYLPASQQADTICQPCVPGFSASPDLDSPCVLLAPCLASTESFAFDPSAPVNDPVAAQDAVCHSRPDRLPDLDVQILGRGAHPVLASGNTQAPHALVARIAMLASLPSALPVAFNITVDSSAGDRLYTVLLPQEPSPFTPFSVPLWPNATIHIRAVLDDDAPPIPAPITTLVESDLNAAPAGNLTFDHGSVSRVLLTVDNCSTLANASYTLELESLHTSTVLEVPLNANPCNVARKFVAPTLADHSYWVRLVATRLAAPDNDDPSSTTNPDPNATSTTTPVPSTSVVEVVGAQYFRPSTSLAARLATFNWSLDLTPVLPLSTSGQAVVGWDLSLLTGNLYNDQCRAMRTTLQATRLDADGGSEEDTMTLAALTQQTCHDLLRPRAITFGVESSATYAITATITLNESSVVNDSATLETLLSAAPAVSNVVLSTTTTTATITWSLASDDNRARAIDLSYTSSQSNNAGTLTLPTSANNLTLTQLWPNETVTITLQTRGNCLACASTPVVVRAATQPMPNLVVTDIVATNVTFDAIALAWQPPSLNEEDGVEHAYLRLTVRTMFFDFVEEHDIPLTQTARITADLLSLRTYRFQFQVLNTTYGAGEVVEQNFTTLQDPRIPASVVLDPLRYQFVRATQGRPTASQTQLQISWTTENIVVGNATFVLNITINNASTSSIRVVGQEAYTLTVGSGVYVRATIAVAGITATQAVQVPPAPTLLHINTNATCTELECGPRGTHFLIASREDDPLNFLYRTLMCDASNTFYLCDLEEFSSYTLWASYADSRSNSSFSLPVGVDTDAAIPSAPPLNVAVSEITATTAQLSWESPPPLTLNGKLQSYRVVITSPGLPASSQDPTTTSLMLTALRPYRAYTVTVAVQNIEGIGPASMGVVFTTAQGQASAVRSLEAVNITSTSITLTWAPPELPNGIVTSYNVTRAFANSVGETLTISATGLTATIPATPYTEYAIVVVAINSAGASLPNNIEVLSLSAPPTAVLAAPAIVRRGSRNVTLSFSTTPLTGAINGPVASLVYLIQVARVAEVDGETEEIVTYNATASPVTVEGLRPNQVYQTSLLVMNDAGSGPTSAFSTFQTAPALPSAAPVIVTINAIENNLLVRWDGLDAQDQNGQVSAYFLIVTPQSLPDLPLNLTIQADGDAGVTVVQGLEYNEFYLVSIAAINQVGVGPFSEPVIAPETQRSSGNAPRFVRVANITSRAALIEWQPPTGTTSLGGYALYAQGPSFQLANGTDLKYPLGAVDTPQGFGLVVDADTTAFWVQGLVPDTQYQFYVIAFSRSDVFYDSSAIVGGFTLEDRPTLPLDLRFPATYLQATSLQFSWNRPDPDNGEITGYRVCYARRTNASAGCTIQELAQLEYVCADTIFTAYAASGLMAYSNYIFGVEAYTEIGSSSFAVSCVRTAVSAPIEAPSVQVTSLGSNGFTVGLYAPVTRTGPIVRYRFNYEWTSTIRTLCPDGQAARQCVVDIVVDADDSEVGQLSVANLEPNAEYRLYARAYTERNGALLAGPASTPILVTTLPSRPGEAVQDLGNRTTINATSLVTSWRPPYFPNGEIVEYNVSWVQSSECGDAENNTLLQSFFPHPADAAQPVAVEDRSITGTELVAWQDGGLVNFTIPDLLPYTLTSIWVAAATVVGYGPTSDPLCIRTAEAPAQPVTATRIVSVGTDNLALTWQSPQRINGELLNYELYACPLSDRGAATAAAQSNACADAVSTTTSTTSTTSSSSTTTTSTTPTTPTTSTSTTSSTANGGSTSNIQPGTEDVDASQGSTLTAQPASSIATSSTSTSSTSSTSSTTRSTTSSTSPTSVSSGVSTVPTLSTVPSGSTSVGTTTTSTPTAPPDPTLCRAPLPSCARTPVLVTAPAGTAQAQLTGLHPNTLYAVGVRAINNAGAGALQFALRVVLTATDIPAVAPVQPNVSDLSTSGSATDSTRSAQLSWAPLSPTDANGEVTYEVVVERVGRTYNTGTIAARNAAAGPDEPDAEVDSAAIADQAVATQPLMNRRRRQEQGTFTTTTPQLLLDELLPAALYNVTIAARTSAGRGPRSAPITFNTTEGIPFDAPTVSAFETADGVRISWDPPSQPNGQIVSYILWTSVDGEEASSQLLTARMYDLSLDKERSVSYEFRVAANTAAGRGPASDTEAVTIAASSSGQGDSGSDVIVGIVIPVVVVLIILAVLLVYQERRRARRQVDKILAEQAVLGEKPYNFKNLHQDLMEENSNEDDEELYGHIHRNKQPYELPSRSLVLDKILGSGAFGEVWLATLDPTQLPSKSTAGVDPPLKGKTPIKVAVKMLKKTADRREAINLLAEASLQAQFDHPNVLTLLGAVTIKSPVLVMPFCPNGSLELYLRREDANESWFPFFILDIARGMSYLADFNFVHRDIAARNILLEHNFNCVISDFGMSRGVANADDYYTASSAKVPIRWTAPEAVVSRKFSEATDVWSFGITMWEIFTHGERPYGPKSNFQVQMEVLNGYRLSQPTRCDDAFYLIMRSGWDPDPHKRPAFKDIYNMLKAIIIYRELMDTRNVSASSDSNGNPMTRRLTQVDETTSRPQPALPLNLSTKLDTSSQV
ncbi:uncharacterized protein MONBRDRAFT_44299 [Monosiga brevicollis MX1]|uniref:receptor protein-tyrosine kinase n=1 Tax=Monosiga brevicollis TaxID=81824 RepID=A9V2D0_MONBE|nr:uncharacterized protein MONBRDRAFT_44299 [Monosiga brevicollis MX1]EDQ88354.1 predicted protein [Monosiga brevicollis MX1]|eukprot:XP_001746947.1 hypothetical protein [Monosiga brevicollis MX1]